jgi:hypothetical protein
MNQLRLDGGRYTPTLTNVANLDTSTAYELQWMRVGDVVTVSGKVDVNPTANATLTQLGISLPVPSNFAAQENCGGTGAVGGVAGMSAAILADTTNDRALLSFTSNDTTDRSMIFSFTYLVIE